MQPGDGCLDFARHERDGSDPKSGGRGQGDVAPRVPAAGGGDYLSSEPSSGVMSFAAAAAFADTSGGEITRPLAAR